jgi:OHCU decarboxylase
MTVTIDELNALPSNKAAEQFTACCGSTRWVTALVGRRPFASLDQLLTAADDVWTHLAPADWLEAFAHHPRIGERRAAVPQNGRAADWSAGEQSRVSTATSSTQAELAAVNEQYERRFGYIYIVCATGRSAEELLSLARARMNNDEDTELRMAAEEQRKITTLRLRKLITEPA